jgi:hypothetical protein
MKHVYPVKVFYHTEFENSKHHWCHPNSKIRDVPMLVFITVKIKIFTNLKVKVV